jgi:hypothetical protein
MSRYEFRILQPEGRKPQIVACHQSCDFAAILYARNQFPLIHGIEIWRGMKCIYARYPGIPAQKVGAQGLRD